MSEEITIFMPLSGRWHLWERRRSWLLRQRYPREKLHFVAANCSGEKLSFSTLFLGSELTGWSSINLYSQPVGRPGLADDPKRDPGEVYDAMLKIYQRMIEDVRTNKILILEDDVFADNPSLITKLLLSFDEQTISASVAYQHREQPQNYCCWLHGKHLPIRNAFSGDLQEYKQEYEVDGHGFGCCLVDTDHFRSIFNWQVASKTTNHLDWDFFVKSGKSGYRSVVDFSIQADHCFARNRPD